jgi:hypothetical protein
MGTRRGKGQFQGVFDEFFTYFGTLDVASLVDAAGASSTITVPGVALGDMVIGRSMGVSTAGISVTADVTAADTVIVRFQNESGGTLDLASTTLRLLVGRPNNTWFM